MTTLSFPAAYQQFYLFVEGGSPPCQEAVSDSDIQAGVKAIPYLVAIYPRSEDEVAVTIVEDGEPLSCRGDVEPFPRCPRGRHTGNIFTGGASG